MGVRARLMSMMACLASISLTSSTWAWPQQQPSPAAPFGSMCGAPLVASVQASTPVLIESISATTSIYRVVLNGLTQFVRVDYPHSEPIATKAPWIVFAHGRVGPQSAAEWQFNLGERSYYGDLIEAFRQAGFVVVFPGYRGHGTRQGQPSEGLDYLEAFDNQSYLIPYFYAADLIAVLRAFGRRFTAPPSLFSHSQGADAALIAVAALSQPAAQSRVVPQALTLWNGTIANRLEQHEFFSPKASYPLGLQTEVYTAIKAGAKAVGMPVPSNTDIQAFLERCDTLQGVKHIRTPTQIHYTDKDPYSPAQWNESVFKALPDRSRSRLHFYPGNDHEFHAAQTREGSRDVDRQRMLKATIQFFQESTP